MNAGNLLAAGSLERGVGAHPLGARNGAVRDESRGVEHGTVNDRVSSYLDEVEAVIRSISRSDVRAVVDELFAAWQAGRTTYIIGNGGSASTASHMMNDLSKMTAVAGLPRFRAIALTDNMPLITAVGNDIEYADIFVEQLRSLLLPTDNLIAISGSGNSENIIRAARYAREIGAHVIALCGDPGSRICECAGFGGERQRRQHLPARRRTSGSQSHDRARFARSHRRRRVSRTQRAVVTGGAGFIGSHVVDALLARDAKVTVVDNFSTGRPENLAHVAGRVTIEHCDINEFERLQSIFANADTVFHLGGLADIVPSIERPTEYFRANVDGTQSVMEAARSAGVRRVVYAASSSCYGIPDAYPTP